MGPAQLGLALGVVGLAEPTLGLVPQAPGLHHVEPRTFKDVFPRYKTMTGHLVPRKAGWDCHGLPVEVEVEKEIGTRTKRDIERFGIAEFTRLCRESLDLAPLLRGHWHDFVMHAKWSPDPAVAFLEMWIDGVNVLPTHRAPSANPVV